MRVNNGAATHEGRQHAGVIVVYGIQVWMAEAVDASTDSAAAL